MRKIFFLSAVMLLSLSCTRGNVGSGSFNIVPRPENIEIYEDSFRLDRSCPIVYEDGYDNPAVNENLARNASFLQQYVKDNTGIELKVVPTSQLGKELGRRHILLEVETSEDDIDRKTDPRILDSYHIEISTDGITVSGISESGVFYGIQTLRKMIPVIPARAVSITCGKVDDAPRFSYRGAMLDVSRHFFPVEFIKRYIDILALHNINRFHWHLTDDQGWRIEIRSRPELTVKGSVRNGTMIGKDWDSDDGVRYGGYYTQEQAREIVEYAAERYITVIPEVDMPGHMLAALASYPELGCTGGPYEVWKQWGVSEDVLCVGKEETFDFIEDVLSEIMEIFPSEYIHIGGDECPKVRWESCPVCRRRIAELGLRDDGEHTAEQKLQSYAVERVERFVNSKGRKIIGWNEILEGGLAPNAAVMSWTGIEGGIEAAMLKHDVVMTPTSYLYFDYYQSTDIENEPLAIGGYVPVEKVYSFDPVPEILKGTDYEKYIRGVQANLWTEYISTAEQVEYMLLPRLAALAEVQWSDEGARDYDSFLERLPSLLDIYDLYGYSYARHLYDVKCSLSVQEDAPGLSAELFSCLGDEIYYTVDGSPVTDSEGNPSESALLYESPVEITSSCTLKAVAFSEGRAGRTYERTFSFNKATGRGIVSNTEIKKDYRFDGPAVLVDGISGDADNFRNGKWIAYYANDMDVVLDLTGGSGLTEVSEVSFNIFVSKPQWIFDVRSVDISVSEDGENYRSVASCEYPVMKSGDPDGIYPKIFGFAPVNTRYLRIKASPEYNIPEWHSGKGNPSFIFVDEIIVR